MLEFTIGIPLTVPPENIWNWMIEHDLIFQAPLSDELFLHGIQYKAYLRPAHPELVSIFNEHQHLETSEIESLKSHRSILFLVGRIKDREAFLTIQDSLTKFLEAGALGIVMEHSGAAYTREDWLEKFSEDTVEGWINWILMGGELRTFGLEIFGLADIAIPCRSDENTSDKEETLIGLANDQFIDQTILESNCFVVDVAGTEYLVNNTSKSPYSKEHPHFNKRGLQQLIKRTRA